MKNYGTATLAGGKWTVVADPHVMIKLRRVFAQADRGGAIKLSNTADVCRELEWFAQRYPLEFDPKDVLTQQAAKHKEAQSIVEQLLGGTRTPQEVKLAVPARDYQLVAANMATVVKRYILADDLGVGKQQPVDMPVLTPRGWREIGSLRVGDPVIGSDGTPATVTGVFPQGVKPSYRLTFSDGASTEAGPEHLWAMDYRRGGRDLARIVVTTEQMRTGANVGKLNLGKTKLFAPILTAPVLFETGVALPISPYLMGQLLANGSLAHGSASITSARVDWDHVQSKLLAEGALLGAVNMYETVVRVYVPGLMPTVRTLGIDVLSGAKFIPEMYQSALVHQRIALLHGLMDADGSAYRARVSYSTTSPQLAKDVRELVEGLGGVVRIHVYDRTSEGKGVEYDLNVRMPTGIDPFSLPRKSAAARCKRRVNPTRRLESIEFVRNVESVCISIDAPDRLYVTSNCILTHNTASGIASIVASKTPVTVIVTMTHLVKQWKREIARFAPALSVHIIKPGALYDYTAPSGRKAKQSKLFNMHPDVVILNYHKLAKWSDTLGSVLAEQRGMLIFDECQELRGGTSTARGQGAMGVSQGAEYCIGLSATPFYNRGGEFWHVMNLIKPDALGSFEEYFREWCSGTYDKAIIENPVAFNAFLLENGLMLRRTRQDVGRELPALTNVIHEVESDGEELQAILGQASTLAQLILARGSDRNGQDAFHASGQLDAMVRKATGVDKAPYVAEFVKMVLESEEKVILFGHHHRVFDIWAQKLKDYNPVRYTGEESAKEKEAAVEAFTNGSARVFIISNRAGAGLDGLQHVCRTVVIGELDWAWAVHDQGIGRAHRDQQQHPVTAYWLISDSGSDPIVVDVLGVKRNQLNGVRNGSRNVVTEAGNVEKDHVKRLAQHYMEKRKEA